MICAHQYQSGRGAVYEPGVNCAWALGEIGQPAALALLRLGAVDALRAALDSDQEPVFRVAHAALASQPYQKQSQRTATRLIYFFLY